MLQVYNGGVDSNVQITMSTFRANLVSGRMNAPHKHGLPLAAAALLLLACGRGAAAGPGQVAANPAQAVMANVLNAWDRADARAIAAQYESRGDFVSPDGVHAAGRREIEAFYRAAFARGYEATKATATVVHVRYLSGTVAFIDGTWTIEPSSTSKVRKPEVGLFFAAIHWGGGRWLITALREQSSAKTLRELHTPAS